MTIEDYKPIEREGGESIVFETYGEDLAYIRNQKPNHVWTLVDTDDDLWIVSGYHLVNRVHYIVTEKPWEASTSFRYIDREDME